MSIFDLLISGSGVYLIYIAILMKWKGEIRKGVIVSKDVNPERIRDKEGFINYMFPKTLVIGALTAAVGCLNMSSPYISGSAWLPLAIMAGYFAALMAFASFTMKARKKFID